MSAGRWGQGAVAFLALALSARATPAQQVTLGPQFVLASYREVTSGLRYQGSGVGGVLSARHHRLSAAAAVSRVSFHPTSGSSADSGFTATQVDAWLAYDVAAYASLEAGITHRSADPEFDAQSVGAVRVGARAFSEIGAGATMSFRADYLAAPQFSGGGRAPVSLDLGLDLDVQLAGRLHGTAGYEFQRIDRKTNPGGTGEIDAPIEQSLARLGIGFSF
jgi:hypothetical protein